MNRLAKKCFIAAAGTHLLLCLLLIFGSAFFVSHDKNRSTPPLRAVPSRLIDEALSGGGGNPKIAPSDGQLKGQTLVAQPVQPQHVEQSQPRPVEPVQREVKAKPEVKKVEKTKPPKEHPKEVIKDSPKPRPESAPRVTKNPPLELKPVTRPTVDKIKQQAEAEAREAKAKEAAEAKEAAAAQRRVAQAFAKANERLKEGFSQGTKVEISGPGGEAYADYSQFVKNVYEDAWTVTDDLTDESSTAKVSVTIAKSGRVISAHLDRPSGNSVLDKSVQRALDKVRFVAPFPEGATDDQRTFLINFNLKAKHLLG